MPIGNIDMRVLPDLKVNDLIGLDKKKIYIVKVRKYNKSMSKKDLQEYTNNLKKIFKKFKLKVIIMVMEPGMDAWAEVKDSDN